jgi:hypothetical protein
MELVVGQRNGSGVGSEIEKRLMMGRSKVWVRRWSKEWSRTLSKGMDKGLEQDLKRTY